MIIRGDQIEAFERSSQAAYAKSAATYLERYEPGLEASVGRPRLEEAALEGLEAARRHDLASGAALQLYLELMVSLGCGFDTDPQFDWLRPYLDKREDMDAVERARLIHFHVIAYLNRAHGTSNEFARAALERTLEILPRFAGNANAREVRGSDMLAWLHPERTDFVSPEAAAQLLDAARRQAAEAGLQAPNGTNLMLVLMFLFGHQIGADPLYPWAGEALRGASAGMDRLGCLVEGARNHLSAVLRRHRKEQF